MIIVSLKTESREFTLHIATGNMDYLGSLPEFKLERKKKIYSTMCPKNSWLIEEKLCGAINLCLRRK